MGGDGGSIPKRIELVRSRQKPEQVAKEAELAARWLHCQLSQERLQRPVVACQLGRLYNKTAALEFLLDRDKFASTTAASAGDAAAFGHIRALRDLRELRLADNPEHRPDDVAKGGNAASAYSHVSAPPFACPLSGVELNGRFKFVFPWACGCVLAEKALERVGSGDSACPVCQRPGAMADLVQLNPATEAEVAAVADAMAARRRRAAAASASSAGGKRNASAVATAAAASTVAKVARPSSSSTASAAGTSKVAKVSGSGGGGIQNDPKASAALKSLFTTSKAAKEQGKAHWVTFNPGYFR